MPYALVAIGIVMIVTAIKNTYGALGTLLKGDFTGPKNFTYWIAAIGIVGMIGYYAPFRPLSRAFLILIVTAIVLKNGGFASQFTNAIQAGPISPPAAPVASAPSSAASSSSSGSSTAQVIGQAAQVAMFLG